jgi:hypothetical protein
MSVISRITTWSDGQTLTASALNGEFNNILSDYNGSITNANISAGAAIAVSKIATGLSGSLVGTTDIQTLTNKTLTSPTITNAAFSGGGALVSKIITATKDISSGGDVSYTGVGFTPTAIIVLYSLNNSPNMGIGAVDSSKTNGQVTQYSSGVSFGGGTGSFINAEPANGSETRAIVKSFDADGFTLTWTPTAGTPTGTINLCFMCFR